MVHGATQRGPHGSADGDTHEVETALESHVRDDEILLYDESPDVVMS